MIIVSSVNQYLDTILRLTINQEEVNRKVYQKMSEWGHSDINNIDYYRKLSELKRAGNKAPTDQLYFNMIDKQPNYKFYYRGHYSIDYHLIPSVFRENNWYTEDWYYHEIMVRCPEHFQYATHLDKLVTMQHYECPTRLLDVTSNPLVALYFACKNFGCNSCNKCEEGEVIVFPVNESEILYSDSDRALMLSCIPRFPEKDKQELQRLAYENIFRDNFKKKTNGSYEDSIVERFFHEVTTELPSFKRELKPIDLLMPIFVQPNKTNGRIIKQDGAFIISGLSKNAYDAEGKLKATEYCRISIKNKDTILRELSMIGINEATLFPEVDKVAHFLKESNT